MLQETNHQMFRVFRVITALCIATAATSCSKTEQPASNSAPASARSQPSSGGDFEGTIAMKMEGENQKEMEMTYFLKGPHTRIETRIPDVREGSAVMLWDTEGGKMTTLMPSRKMYITMDMKAGAEEMKNAAKEMRKSRGEEEETEFPKLTSTGKQETIAGYPCEHWLMGDKQELDMCVAKGIGYFGMGGQGRGGLDSWKNLAFSPKMLAEAANHPEWAKFLEGGAFPLKLTATEDGKVTMKMEATSVERKALDDTLFTIPPDYKEMSMPTMPRQPSAKQ